MLDDVGSTVSLISSLATDNEPRSEADSLLPLDVELSCKNYHYTKSYTLVFVKVITFFLSIESRSRSKEGRGEYISYLSFRWTGTFTALIKSTGFVFIVIGRKIQVVRGCMPCKPQR